MADDKAKKTKIDLKARLGKTAMGMTTPGATPAPMPSSPGVPPPSPSDPGSGPSPFAAPLPSTTPAIGSVRPPQGIAPPPGMSPGIPIPPFGPRPQPQRQEPKPSAAQQTIKVEMGEEIHEERKKAGRRALLIAGIAAVAAGTMGFFIGQVKADGDRVKGGQRGAVELEKSVKAANDRMKELDAKLTEGADKLKNKSFPDDLAQALGGLKIPFETGTLDGKRVGDLPPKVLKMVLLYTKAVEDVDKQREALAPLLGARKEALTKLWDEEKTPMTNFSVVFRGEGQNKIVAELVPNKKPFSWKGDFDAGYTVTRMKAGKPAEEKVTRWVKGDLTGSDTIAIPVDPKSMSTLPQDPGVGYLFTTLYKLREVLQGTKDAAGNDESGLLKSGDDLAAELHKVAAASQ